MTPIEKNQHYHNILAILSEDEYSTQQKAQQILLYLENLLQEQKIQEEEQQNNGYSPTKFRGTFRRST